LTEPQYQAVASRLRKLARDPDCDWAFNGHADDEMAKDGIEYPDVTNLIARGSVIREEKHGQVWRQTVQGRDSEGETIAVVICLDEAAKRIEVITAWRLKK